MLGWPADGTESGQRNRVIYLSGMLDNLHDAEPEKTGKAEATEPVTHQKSNSKAS